VLQGGDGTFSLDETFIPPVLRLQASATLVRVVRRLLEALHNKSTALSELRSQRTTGLLDFGSSDLGQAWLLTIVNSFIPLLNHYSRHPRSHPEALFVSLARFAGQLTTFSSSTHPRDLPDYDHLDLSRTFLGLEKVVQDVLRLTVASGAVEIPLQRETDSKFSAAILDDQLLQGSQLFLAARADVPEHQLIEELPRQAKISSAERIMALLGLALPGVAIVYQPAPPPALRVKLGMHYFRLESRGDPENRKHWEYICGARNVVIRVPGQRFPNLRLELWAIKE
jgi:type VI secretion system protein ImpJ